MTSFIVRYAMPLLNETGHQSVAYALADVQQDLARKCRISAPPAQGALVVRLDAAVGGFDRYRIDVTPHEIAVTGSDELGAIHGLYAFAEHFLEADPFHYFTGIMPETVDQVAIPCGEIISAPYTFRHRGFFFNDEDLLVGFQLEKPEHGFSLDVWQALYSIALRMQCTCVIPGTNILPDEPHVKLASDRGLYIAQHHAEPVGSAPFFWPRAVPFSWTTHREFLIEYWRRAISRQAGKKVLWTLGFRGLLDRPFWHDDPAIADDTPLSVKGQIISEALQVQYDLIREIRGEEHPEVFGYLWGEQGRLFREGVLTYPEEMTLLISDGGNAQMPADLETMVAKAGRPTGVYQHVSMFTGQTSVRVNSFPPEIIEAQVARCINAGMTEMFMLNVGNVREKVFGIRQMMAYATHDQETRETFTGSTYYEWYARTQLQSAHPEVADVYRQLIEIPRQHYSYLGDNKYTNIVRYTLQKFYRKAWDDVPDILRGQGPYTDLRGAMTFYRDLLAEYRPRWAVAVARARDARKHLEGSRLAYFEQEALAQTEKVSALNHMALEFCTSVLQYLDEDYYQAYLSAYQALRHCDEALAVERSTEQGAFQEWHRNDLNCRTWKCREFLATYHTMLDHLRWMNLEGLAEGPQPVYAAYKYQPHFDSAYRAELHLQPER